MVHLSETSDGRVAVAFPYNPDMVDAVKAIPGRRWDGDHKRWTVPMASASHIVAFLRRTGDPDVNPDLLERILAAAHEQALSLAQSRASDAEVDIPVPNGLAYLPYQKAGIAFAANRAGVLIADEMGLGKTIQAIGVINADPTIARVLVVCPASLKVNWSREVTKWSVRPVEVAIGDGTVREWNNMFTRSDVQVLVVNYDVLPKWREAIDAIALDLLVVDEAHYVKSPSAQRTVAVLGKWDKDPLKAVAPIAARRRVFLTGTPILNRPVEMWGLAHSLAPEVFPGWRSYVTRYCAAFEDRYGWNTSGASNLDELQDRLRSSIMVRRLKADVLTDLPAKRRAVIELPANGSAALVAEEVRVNESSEARLEPLRTAVLAAEASDDPLAYKRAVEALRAAQAAEFTEMARLRHEVALAKVPLVLAHLADSIEQGKVVCFAHHHDVVNAIVAAFPEAAVVTGDTPLDARQAAVDRFQSDPTCRLFVGNIRAAGVGLTLTASSHVVFAELDWTPGNITQAEDRCHRIGQRDSVLVQHLVLEGSLDARMAKMVVEKQQVIDAALDAAPAPIVETPIVIEPPIRPATPAPAPVPSGLDVSSLVGGYAVTNGEGNLTFLWFDQPDPESRWHGWVFVAHQLGPNKDRLGRQRPGGTYEGGLPTLIAAVLADPKEARLTYGKELGICGDCGRALTNAESRERGIGPICAAKAGW